MNAVTDFKSIKRKLDRMEQKAEYDAKNPEPAPATYGWPYMTPYGEYISPFGSVPVEIIRYGRAR